MTARQEARGEHLSDYHLLTRTFLYINKRLYRDTIERLAGNLCGLVVDVGCGQAPYRPLLTRATRYVGIDTGQDRMADVIGDAQRLPVASGVAESILCTEVLEHAWDPDAVVREIFRTLKPDGILLLTAPMSWNLHYEPHDYRRYTCYGLWQLLEAHGFEIAETRRIGGLFSLVGSRLVDGIATELYHRMTILPPKARHGVILLYSIPVSLVFMLLARLGDRFQRSDAIGWAILARKHSR